MTTYEKRRVQIWMTQVRRKGSTGPWCVTGAHWYSEKTAAITARKEAEAMWDIYEYRTAKYMPEATHE